MVSVSLGGDALLSAAPLFHRVSVGAAVAQAQAASHYYSKNGSPSWVNIRGILSLAYYTSFSLLPAYIKIGQII